MPVKKGFVILTLFMSLLFVSACQKQETVNFNFFNYMDTFISISVTTESKERANELKIQIQEIYRTYHELTNNYKQLSHNSGFKENLYSINQRINEDIEIDYELYEILEEAERLKIMTNGYFDISIGKMVKVWKDVILDDVEDYYQNELPQEVFQGILDQLKEIELVENPYTLSIKDGKYFIRINHEDVNLDLGALSKGYATQLVHDYLVEEGIKYFSITAGSSSISLGKRIKRKSEMFHIELTNPLKVRETYGLLYLQNTSVTTSGNFEQYALYEGLRYHHVISPFTKMPVHYYHTVTMVGADAGVLDAISTALISMSPEVFGQFMANHQEELGIEIIRFNYDGTVTTFLTHTVFEEYE